MIWIVGPTLKFMKYIFLLLETISIYKIKQASVKYRFFANNVFVDLVNKTSGDLGFGHGGHFR